MEIANRELYVQENHNIKIDLEAPRGRALQPEEDFRGIKHRVVHIEARAMRITAEEER